MYQMSYTFQNLLTGLSQGRFDSLQVRNASGDYVDVLTLGGSGALAANAPISISGGVLSIDLSNYTDTTGLTTLLASKLSTTHEAAKLGSSDVTHRSQSSATSSPAKVWMKTAQS